MSDTSLEILNPEGDVIGEIGKEGWLDGLMRIYNEEKCARAEGEVSDPLRVPRRDYTGFPAALKKRQASIRRTLNELVGDVPFPGEFEKRKDSIEELVCQYVSLEFRRDYDLLSNDLFQLERRIYADNAKVINRQHGKPEFVDAYFEVPLFFEAKLTQSSTNYKFNSEDAGYKYEVEIKSDVPPITKRAKENARHASARYHSILSRALEDGHMGSLIHKALETGYINLDFKVYWIPKPSELHIEATAIDKDPLLVAHLCSSQREGYSFLIDRWDVQGELPYEHYLAEFTEEKAGA